MAPISKETALRSDGPVHSSIIDPRTGQAQVSLPSETVAPTKVDTARQQASTQPGDGTEVRAGPTTSHTTETQAPAESAETARVSFKEQVIGVAQKTRGKLLQKPELKEHGEQILEGKVSYQEPVSK